MKALKLLEIERPNDPISFISFYMLKNKSKIDLPKKKEPGPLPNEENSMIHSPLAHQTEDLQPQAPVLPPVEEKPAKKTVTVKKN